MLCKESQTIQHLSVPIRTHFRSETVAPALTCSITQTLSYYTSTLQSAYRPLETLKIEFSGLKNVFKLQISITIHFLGILCQGTTGFRTTPTATVIQTMDKTPHYYTRTLQSAFQPLKTLTIEFSGLKNL